MPLLPIETDRLVLRDFEINDWREVHAYASDAEALRYLEWGPNTEQQTIDFILSCMSLAQQAEQKQHHAAIVLKNEDRLIGACALDVVDPVRRTAAIGYVLNRDSWGRGYATEAAHALIAAGFERLGLHRIIATCDTRNAASARVLEKCGMRREGTLRKDKWQKGEWRDSHLYAIIEEDPRP